MIYGGKMTKAVYLDWFAESILPKSSLLLEVVPHSS
jgi:hypothetical protein